MRLWALEQTVVEQLEAASRQDPAALAAALVKFEARERELELQARVEGGAPRRLRIAGDVAQIDVTGVLTKRPDFMAWLLGMANTTYGDLQAAIAAAEADPAVASVVWNFDTPGGEVDGLFETLGMMEAMKKPSTARASLAASAGYALAAAAGPIAALSPASRFGSIGILASVRIDPMVVDITSTNAPAKRPNVQTDEGRAEVRKYLDATHDLFARAIARGRSSTVDQVNADFGRGAVLLAAEAKSRGMIDALPGESVSTRKKTKASAEQGGAEKESHMKTIAELKAQHPDLAAELVKEGENKERSRVSAHLTLAEASGDTATAYAAIRSGASSLDEEIQSKHLAARMNRTAVNDRATETADPAKAAAGSTPAITTTADDRDAEFVKAFNASKEH